MGFEREGPVIAGMIPIGMLYEWLVASKDDSREMREERYCWLWQFLLSYTIVVCGCV